MIFARHVYCSLAHEWLETWFVGFENSAHWFSYCLLFYIATVRYNYPRTNTTRKCPLAGESCFIMNHKAAAGHHRRKFPHSQSQTLNWIKAGTYWTTWQPIMRNKVENIEYLMNLLQETLHPSVKQHCRKLWYIYESRIEISAILNAHTYKKLDPQ